MSNGVNDSVRYLATLTNFINNFTYTHCEHAHSFPIKITHQYYVLSIAKVNYEMQVEEIYVNLYLLIARRKDIMPDSYTREKGK